MKKNIYSIIALILAVILFITMLSITTVRAGGAESSIKTYATTISEAYIPSETTLEESTTNPEEVIATETMTREESTTQRPETSTSRVENHPTTTKPTTRVSKTQQDNGEYPVATYVWNYMKSLGWSDAVCAGIMGNMMAEVGGQTLNLNYRLYDSTGNYYGICQWSSRYYGQIHGADLETQCNFLRDTIKKEIDIYGKRYQAGMNFEKFLQIDDPEEAALCFAMAYERCASWTYDVRQRNAVKAYDYFVG